MSAESHGPDLVSVVALLGAAVVAVPLFKRLGLGSVLGYLVAGLVIGPFGIGLFTDAQAILHVAELGVVMFLFIIGLEMEPSRLWGMRQQIFGLGVAQVGVCMALLGGIAWLAGYPPVVAFVAGTGFVLTSTAIVMQMLEERRMVGTRAGQRIIAVLLLEDLAIVPLLALVAFLAPGAGVTSAFERWQAVGIGLASIAALVAAGLYLLNPMFRLLAEARAREVMTAAALLVVLGSALAMQLGGLSMAMGAFLAGVLLSESAFRHQLEADVEPFRGLLLGLFFLAVGMSLDLAVIGANWVLVAGGVVACMVVKAVAIYAVARAGRADHREALERAVLMAQGGEFAFVLYAAAAAVGIIDGPTNAVLTATVIVSMVLTPVMIILHDRMVPAAEPSLDGVEAPSHNEARVLIIGFGRFGQIAGGSMLTRNFTISVIDIDPEMVREANAYGFKVHYGDGTRLDILHAAGAGRAEIILCCVDDRDAALRIIHLLKSEFRGIPVLARAFDREHAMRLLAAGADEVVRETFESALSIGRSALIRTGTPDAEADEVIATLRRRDAERFALEASQGMEAGRRLLLSHRKDWLGDGAEAARDPAPQQGGG
ncbi:monovalent cation:proton antiporter-2 (CPA2) family protein [Roseomonas fluvialis]|uniref:Potassium efflux system protein n=1 Tax=Roseomonas fluvialis TaxID=1750527 RepID=A0ABN6P5E1_9PROT|nr:monovalent cation:proton antiporter-2 (CPA2) family protein [Roseomonas fluvialis]BDG72882.1 potassium efflux system protein [Roseomonas fluvialis]